MKILDVKTITAIVLFITAGVSGFMLAKEGRPLNTAIFTVHKLAAIIVFVLLIIKVRTMGKGAELNASMTAIIMLPIILFALIIATGGMLSFNRFESKILKIIHAVLPLLTLISSAVTIYLLKGK